MAGKDINKLHEFLKNAGTYYLATMDGDQPRVRPFGTTLLYENKIYLLTSQTKDVSRQLKDNSNFEISAMDESGRWIRVAGKLVQDNRLEVHKAMLDEYPHLRGNYQEGEPNTNTLYMSITKAIIYSFTEEPIELEV